MNKTPVGPSYGLLLLLAATALRAEPAADAATQLDTLQVTAGKRVERTSEAPQGITVVSREEIQAAAPQIWADALRGQPGAFYQSSGPGQGMVIVRGLKGSEVLHLVDGMRLNNAMFRNAPSQYIALVDALSLDRIELLRGPSSALYGSDAMGGVVQLLTPEQRFDAEHWQQRGQLSFRASSQDLSYATRASVAAGRSGTSVQLGVTTLNYGERITAADGRLDRTDYDARGLDAKLQQVFADGEWTASIQDFRIPQLTRYHQVVAGFDSEPSSEIARFLPNRRQATQLRYRHLATLGPVEDLTLRIGQQTIIDHQLSRDLGSDINEFERNRSQLTGVTAQASTTFAAGSHLIYGLDIYHDRISSRRDETDLGTGNTSEVRSRFPDGSEERMLGLFAHQEWRTRKDWLIDLGLRFSVVKTELPAADRGIGVTVDESDISGSLGLSLPVAQRWRWLVNAGRGFRAPNVFDLGTLGERPGNRFNVPNPDLQPETLLSLDTGFKYAGNNCVAEVIAFASDYQDRITTVNTGNPRGDGRTEVQSRNVAEARYRGLELGGRCRLLSAWQLGATPNYTHGEEQLPDSTTPANRVPPLNGQLDLRYLPSANLEMRLTLNFADRQDRLAPSDVRDSRIDPNGTPGWSTSDFQLRWWNQQGTEISAGIRNLFDEAYREHGSGIDGAGRGVIFSLQQRWGG